MKKMIFAFALLVFVSCNSDSKGSSDTDTAATNLSGVQNVNGNIPDTTNSINIESSTKNPDNDSIHHDH